MLSCSFGTYSDSPLGPSTEEPEQAGIRQKQDAAIAEYGQFAGTGFITGEFRVNGLPTGARLQKSMLSMVENALIESSYPGFTQVFAFDMKVNGVSDYSRKAGQLTFDLPAEYINDGRMFELVGFDKGGTMHAFGDTSIDPTEVSFDVDLEGFKFVLLYKD